MQVGSLDQIDHKPGGGDVIIPKNKTNWSHTKSALLIQQLVNATKISQNAFEKTVENLNEIAEGTKMIKQQNDQIASVNKKIYNQQKKYDKNVSQPKDNKTVRFQEKQEAQNVGNYSATKKTPQR